MSMSPTFPFLLSQVSSIHAWFSSTMGEVEGEIPSKPSTAAANYLLLQMTTPKIELAFRKSFSFITIAVSKC